MADYDLVLGALALFFLPFSYSYWLGKKIKSVYLRILPIYFAILAIGCAVWTMLQPAGGFLDLRGVVALILVIIAGLILLGWAAGILLRRYREKRRKKL